MLYLVRPIDKKQAKQRKKMFDSLVLLTSLLHANIILPITKEASDEKEKHNNPIL